MAIRKGLLKEQPCEVCGAEKVEVHHEDYSDHLKVRWLCHKHHVDLHYEIRYGKKRETKRAMQVA